MLEAGLDELLPMKLFSSGIRSWFWPPNVDWCSSPEDGLNVSNWRLEIVSFKWESSSIMAGSIMSSLRSYFLT